MILGATDHYLLEYLIFKNGFSFLSIYLFWIESGISFFKDKDMLWRLCT